MSSPQALVRRNRRAAGLTQEQLARRLGTTQSVVARLERPGANPTVDSLDRVLRATGRRLRLASEPSRSSVDESLIRKHLELSPKDRLALLEAMYEEARVIAAAGERARGDVA